MVRMHLGRGVTRLDSEDHMKVRVTFDISDNDRLLIGTGADEDGKLRPATHEEMVSFIEDAYTEQIEPKAAAFEEFRKEFVSKIKW